MLGKDKLALFATFFAILVYVFISSHAYGYLENSIHESNLYNTAEALGAIFLGFLSDKFCRRKTCLYSYLIGLLLFPLAFNAHSPFILTFLFGFFFNPLPILRAGMIDNLPGLSKVQLISFSFVIQYIPWALYDKIVLLSLDTSFIIGIILLFISLTLSFLFFYDKRDNRMAHEPHLPKLIKKGYKTCFIFTLWASFLAQVVYFFSDNLLENYAENVEFYAILSFGSLVGALIASLYKKTPHVSILTINYGINMLLAIIPFAALYIYGYKDVSIPLMFIIFGTLGGFGIPFVYDVVLNSININLRGTTCGLLDSIYSLSSLINLFIVQFLNLNLFFTLMLIPITYGISTYLQKRTEKGWSH